MNILDLFEGCPNCGGPIFANQQLAEKKDACYRKVRSRYKVWPSAYASGALVQCRKKGAANWGNKSESVEEGQLNELAPNPGGGDGGGGDEGDDGFELPLDFKGRNIMVWPKNKKHSMGDTATPFPRGERFTGKVYIMWDGPKIEAIWYLDPKDREDREKEYERVYGPQGRGWEDWLDHKWYDTTGVRYRLVTDWKLTPAKEPGGWPGIVDAWGQDMKAEVMNYPESFITEIIQKDGDGRHFVEPRQSVAEGQLNEFAPGDGSGEGRWYTDDQMIDMVGPDWAPEDDEGHLTLAQRLQDAQAWLDDQGYSVAVEDVQIDPDGGYRWKIYGEFYNPRFAKKDQGVAEGSDKTFTVVYYSKKTDRNVTKQIKASSESELWDRLRAKGIDVVSIEEQGVAEGSVWSSADQKMKHHSEFPHTHTAVKDIRSSMTDKIIVPKGARLSALGNDNYLNLDTGVQPFKLDPTSLVKQGVAETSDYFRRREREEAIISGQKPARKKQPAQTSDYARRREQEKKAEKGVAEAGPFSHGAKKPRKGSVAHNAEVRRKEQGKNKQPIEPKDQMVGTAKVTKGVAEMDDPRHIRYHQVYGDPGENPQKRSYRGPWYLDVEGSILQDNNGKPKEFWDYDDAFQYAVKLTNDRKQQGQPLKYAILIRKKPIVPQTNQSDDFAEDIFMGVKDPVVVVTDKKTGKYLDKLKLSAAVNKYQLGSSEAVKKQLANQDYTYIGNYTIAAPIGGQTMGATISEDSVARLKLLAGTKKI